MSTITTLGSEITIGAITYKGEKIRKKTFNLKGHEGERVRVHIDNDRKYTISTKPTQNLLIYEFDVPEKAYENILTAEKDENGEYIIEQVEKELDLSEVELIEYLEEK